MVSHFGQNRMLSSMQSVTSISVPQIAHWRNTFVRVVFSLTAKFFLQPKNFLVLFFRPDLQLR